MTDKPPVLSDEEITRILDKHAKENDDTTNWEDVLVQAQRDADVEWYESKNQTKASDDSAAWEDLMGQCDKRVEQARQEGIKEVVDWVGANCIGVDTDTDDPEDYMGIQSMAWQAFTQKYLEPS